MPPSCNVISMNILREIERIARKIKVSLTFFPIFFFRFFEKPCNQNMMYGMSGGSNGLS